MLLPSVRSGATDLHFNDFTNRSPGGIYEFRAESPDNRKSGRRAFQSSFVCVLRDAKTGAALWTRKQAMEEPESSGTNGAASWARPKEGSPVEAFVSDAGWTVILTAWNEIISVDSTGRDRGKIDLLREAFTKEEREQFVSQTTAGPMWAGFSLWYFLDVGNTQFFVIRPWWGRRVVINVATCRLRRETMDVATAIAAQERNEVLAALAKGVATRVEWDKQECCEAIGPVNRAAYLAGCLKIAEAVPFLAKLEDCTYSGSSTTGGLSIGEDFEGRVCPHNYSTLTMRQIIQLSLRRLGKTPQQPGTITFKLEHRDYSKMQPYQPKPLAAPRHLNVTKIARGMKAEQVLDLLGNPDYIGFETWEYDMDAKPPYTLIVKWDVRHVTGIEQTTPAFWQDGLKRDEYVAR